MSAPDHPASLLSPILPVADMDRAVCFYVEILGFEPVRRGGEYSVLRRGGASLHLARSAGPEVMQAVHGHMSMYLEVEDIASLWAHVAPFKNRYSIRDLFDRDYGMREFHIGDPDGCLILVGQPIGAS